MFVHPVQSNLRKQPIMTAHKRWYQLSMLQLLVAMAVVAVFVAKNVSITPNSRATASEPFAFSIVFGDSELALGSLQAGWPLPYWHAFGTVTSEGVYLSRLPTHRWRALVANIVCCVAATVGASMAVSVIARKVKPCPSTST